MPQTIHKYPVPITSEPSIPMPRGAQILHVGVQRGRLHIWATVIVEDKAILALPPMVTRRFRLFGTGEIMPPDPGKYLGTGILHDGDLVVHLYEVIT